jgi:uncharacterized protein YndB with AHSA1/START domain
MARGADITVAGRSCRKEVQMPYTYTLTAIIPASPKEIYEAWLDSISHSEMTGGEATMSDEVGAEVAAWDGYIAGRNLELIPGERIVQSWRTSEFGDEHEDSIVTIVLQKVGDGTLLTLEHANVPDGHKSYEEGGWQSNYFEPMAAYFTERKEEAAETPLEETARTPVRKRAAKRAPKSPAKPAAKHAPKRPAKPAAKSARKPKRAASAKSKRAAPRAKVSSKSKTKSKAKARVVAAATRKRAKPPAPKSGRGKRR